MRGARVRAGVNHRGRAVSVSFSARGRGLNRRNHIYAEGFSGFVASTAAPIATGWSDPCRVGFAPTEDVRLSTAHRKPLCRMKWGHHLRAAIRSNAFGRTRHVQASITSAALASAGCVESTSRSYSTKL